MNKDFEKNRASLQKKLTKKGGVTKTAITNAYGPHAILVLLDMESIVEVDSPRTRDEKRRPSRRYEVASGATLPSYEDFQKALHKKYTTDAKSLIEDAYSQIEELASECREIVDNASGTNFENTQRIETFGETADMLEGVTLSVDLEDWLEDVEVLRLPTISTHTGRGHRLGEATNDLEIALCAIEEHEEEAAEKRGKDVVEELRNHIDECSNAEFPGMYG